MVNLNYLKLKFFGSFFSVFFIFLFLFNYSYADSVTLVVVPEDGLQLRIDMIEQAKDYIYMDYHSIKSDSYSSKILFGLLDDAANDGVEVKILVDGLASQLDNAYIGYLINNSNIEVKFYHPSRGLVEFIDFNGRLHDKLMVVDGGAIIGGRNIDDRHFGNNWSDVLARDRDVYVEGRVVGEMYDYFTQMWESSEVGVTYAQDLLNRDCEEVFFTSYCKGKQNELIFDVDLANDDVVEVLTYYKVTRSEWFNTGNDWLDVSYDVDKIKFVWDPIGKKSSRSGTGPALRELYSSANVSILAQSPYVVPTKNLLEVFALTNKKGINFTFLTNSLAASPNILAVSGYKRYRKTMQDFGLTFWEFQGEDSLHHKTAIIDDKVSFIGSYNVDSRSEKSNTELMIIVYDYEFSQELKDDINYQMQGALVRSDKGKIIETVDLKAAEPSFIKIYISSFLSFYMPLIQDYV